MNIIIIIIIIIVIIIIDPFFYGTTFWRSKELFFSQSFVGLALKGERMRFIYQE